MTHIILYRAHTVIIILRIYPLIIFGDGRLEEFTSTTETFIDL